MPKVKMTVVGIGPIREGVSKSSGKAYSMQDLCVVYNGECYPDFTGNKAETITINPRFFDTSKILLNQEVDAFVHQQNFRTVLDGIL